jgi:hypothetical protein
MLTYDDERICKNPAYPNTLGPAPQTFQNRNTTKGIASLPGDPGIPNPLIPIVMAWLTNKTLPSKTPGSSFWKMPMGDGGSAGGRFANYDPYHPGKLLNDTAKSS